MIQKTYYKTKDYAKIKFSFTVENASSIDIFGLNGDWKTPISLSKKKDGSFSADVSLPKDSRHEFKYLVNGTEWFNDPSADGESQNEFGGTNSVLSI